MPDRLLTALPALAAGLEDDEPPERDEDDDHALDQTDEFPADELPPEADELPARADLDEEDVGELAD